MKSDHARPHNGVLSDCLASKNVGFPTSERDSSDRSAHVSKGFCGDSAGAVIDEIAAGPPRTLFVDEL